MYQLRYDQRKQQIVQIDKSGKEIIITDNHPSRIIFSPDKKKAIFISPLEWEELGSLYMFDLVEGDLTELIIPDENQNVPKNMEWIDNQNIAIVIGYGMGTVEVGGDVFILNILNKKLQQLTNYPKEIQITDMNFKRANLIVSGIKYLDDNYNKSESYNDILSLE